MNAASSGAETAPDGSRGDVHFQSVTGCSPSSSGMHPPATPANGRLRKSQVAPAESSTPHQGRIVPRRSATAGDSIKALQSIAPARNGAAHAPGAQHERQANGTSMSIATPVQEPQRCPGHDAVKSSETISIESSCNAATAAKEPPLATKPTTGNPKSRALESRTGLAVRRRSSASEPPSQQVLGAALHESQSVARAEPLPQVDVVTTSQLLLQGSGSSRCVTPTGAEKNAASLASPLTHASSTGSSARVPGASLRTPSSPPSVVHGQLQRDPSGVPQHGLPTVPPLPLSIIQAKVVRTEVKGGAASSARSTRLASESPNTRAAHIAASTAALLQAARERLARNIQQQERAAAAERGAASKSGAENSSGGATPAPPPLQRGRQPVSRNAVPWTTLRPLSAFLTSPCTRPSHASGISRQPSDPLAMRTLSSSDLGNAEGRRVSSGILSIVSTPLDAVAGKQTTDNEDFDHEDLRTSPRNATAFRTPRMSFTLSRGPSGDRSGTRAADTAQQAVSDEVSPTQPEPQARPVAARKLADELGVCVPPIDLASVKERQRRGPSMRAKLPSSVSKDDALFLLRELQSRFCEASDAECKHVVGHLMRNSVINNTFALDSKDPSTGFTSSCLTSNGTSPTEPSPDEQNRCGRYCCLLAGGDVASPPSHRALEAARDIVGALRRARRSGRLPRYSLANTSSCAEAGKNVAECNGIAPIDADCVPPAPRTNASGMISVRDNIAAFIRIVDSVLGAPEPFTEAGAARRLAVTPEQQLMQTVTTAMSIFEFQVNRHRPTSSPNRSSFCQGSPYLASNRDSITGRSDDGDYRMGSDPATQRSHPGWQCWAQPGSPDFPHLSESQDGTGSGSGTKSVVSSPGSALPSQPYQFSPPAASQSPGAPQSRHDGSGGGGYSSNDDNMRDSTRRCHPNVPPIYSMRNFSSLFARRNNETGNNDRDGSPSAPPSSRTLAATATPNTGRSEAAHLGREHTSLLMMHCYEKPIHCTASPPVRAMPENEDLIAAAVGNGQLKSSVLMSLCAGMREDDEVLIGSAHLSGHFSHSTASTPSAMSWGGTKHARQPTFAGVKKRVSRLFDYSKQMCQNTYQELFVRCTTAAHRQESVAKVAQWKSKVSVSVDHVNLSAGASIEDAKPHGYGQADEAEFMDAVRGVDGDQTPSQERNDGEEEGKGYICSLLVREVLPNGVGVFYAVGCSLAHWDYLLAGPLATPPNLSDYAEDQERMHSRVCWVRLLFPSTECPDVEKRHDLLQSEDGNGAMSVSQDFRASDEMECYLMSEWIPVSKALLGVAMRVWSAYEPHIVSELSGLYEMPSRHFHAKPFWSQWPQVTSLGIGHAMLPLPLIPADCLESAPSSPGMSSP